MKYWKGLALAAALGGLSVVGLTTDAFSQVVPDQPIEGTIPVQEGADYAALAKITADQARTAALAEAPGVTFDESELDEEDGYLVYEVEVTRNGQEMEITVDAGDGSILRTENDD
jgi:uncharacterized membrane protein YkoI